MRPSNESPKLRLRTLSWANVAKYLRYCRAYGVQNATRLAFRKIMRRQRLPGVIEPLQFPPSFDADLEREIARVEKRISVVIPTRDAGGDFGSLLRKLKAQQRVEQIEIIVVDSGSTDKTVEVAEGEGAKVIRIPPESFSHSHARNLGAKGATGDYFLFMVQDALPLTNHWLWEMARSLEINALAGVSCAEYPRADCDLFYRLLLWNHYRNLQLDRDRILQWDPSCTSAAGLRANAQISDISFLIRRELFQEYRYAGEYGEDLELGIRLIRNGHKVGFLYSTRVLHSHNRPAFYFLKRAYVDAKYLVQVLPGFSFPEIRHAERLFEDITGLHERLKTIGSELLNWQGPVGVFEFMDQLRSAILATNHDMADECAECELDDFVSRLGFLHTAGLYTAKQNMIVPHVIQHLRTVEEFLSNVYPCIEETLVSEIWSCVSKIFALHVGTHLAYLYLSQPGEGRDESLQRLDSELAQGV